MLDTNQRGGAVYATLIESCDYWTKQAFYILFACGLSDEVAYLVATDTDKAYRNQEELLKLLDYLLAKIKR